MHHTDLSQFELGTIFKVPREDFIYSSGYAVLREVEGALDLFDTRHPDRHIPSYRWNAAIPLMVPSVHRSATAEEAAQYDSYSVVTIRGQHGDEHYVRRDAIRLPDPGPYQGAIDSLTEAIRALKGERKRLRALAREQVTP